MTTLSATLMEDAIRRGGDAAICRILGLMAAIQDGCDPVGADGLPSDAHCLLAYGRAFPSKPAPDGMRGRNKSCFRTAASWALRDPSRWVYCEGYASPSDLRFPTHHAWLADTADGHAIELMPAWSRAPSVAYFGIAFGRKVLASLLLERSEPVLFRRPVHSPFLDGRLSPGDWTHAGPVADADGMRP